MTKQELVQEYIKCALDIGYFAEKYITVWNKKIQQLVPFKLLPQQRQVLDAYQSHDRVLVSKYRQGGITTLTCLYLAHCLIFRENIKVGVVANKLKLAKESIFYQIVKMIEELPKDVFGRIPKKEGAGSDTKDNKVYNNGAQLQAFAASEDGLRGFVPDILFIDEAAFLEQGEAFMGSAAPTMATGGQLILNSCVTEDTFIFTDKGIKEVKDFISSNDLGFHNIKNYNILGNEKLRSGNLFYNNGLVDTLKIQTLHSKLESSYNHKLWAFSNKENKYDWFRADELSVGDYIAVQYGKEIWGNNNDVSDFIPLENSRNTNKFKPEIITKDLAYFIGLYISEGCGNKDKYGIYNGFTITCGDDISHIFDIFNFDYYCKDELHYEIHSKELVEFFQYLGFDLSKRAKEKTIPSRLFEMGRENIIAMIQGIMDGDGSCTLNKDQKKIRVSLGLSSKRLVEQIRILLNNFGILTEYSERITPPTKKVKVYSNSYRIVANNNFAVEYLNKIGFRFERKQVKLENYILKKSHCGIHDNIPNGAQIATKLIKNEKQQPRSRNNLLKLLELDENFIDFNYKNELISIINKSIYWDKIKSIDKSQNYTYDFSLPDDTKELNDFHHSVIYNGFIGHQTPSGLDLTYYATYEGAKTKKNNYKVVEIYWYEDPRYSEDLMWYRGEELIEERDPDKIKELIKNSYKPTSAWFRNMCATLNNNPKRIASELENKFLGSGGNLVHELDIQYHETTCEEPPIRKENNDEFWIWEEVEEGYDYYVAVDAAKGVSDGDYSTIQIFKSDIVNFLLIQVAEFQGRVPVEILSEYAVRYAKLYNNAYLIIDVTGGWGYTVSRFAIAVYKYKNLHYDAIRDPSVKLQLKDLARGELFPGVHIKDGPTRDWFCNEFERKLRERECIIKSTRLMSEVKTFVYNETKKRYDHSRSTHDDLLMAAAMVFGVYIRAKSNLNQKEYFMQMAKAIFMRKNDEYTSGSEAFQKKQFLEEGEENRAEKNGSNLEDFNSLLIPLDGNKKDQTIEKNKYNSYIYIR